MNVSKNQNNVNGQPAGGNVIADENLGTPEFLAAGKNVMLLKDCDIARNGLEKDLVSKHTFQMFSVLSYVQINVLQYM